MKALGFLTAVSIFGSISTGLAGAEGPTPYNPAEGLQAFNQYCVNKDPELPEVNFSNPEVKRAAGILSKVASGNLVFYSDIKRIIIGKNTSAPADAPKGTTNEAYWFLKILCGDFRDRGTLLRDKIRWVNNTYMLPNEVQATEIDLSKNVWSQLSAQSYRAYLSLSSTVWENKKNLLTGNSRIQFGNTIEAEVPVDGQTVCETKFMISEYIAKGKTFGRIEDYNEGYKNFVAKCSKDDTDYYYNFRGDSNFKPSSPESNGMLWHSQTVAKNCASHTKSLNSKIFPDEQCAAYFKAPFTSRWNASRAGLASWLMHDAKHDQAFAAIKSLISIRPVIDGNLGKSAFPFSLSSGDILSDFDSNTDMGIKDFGFNAMVGIGSQSANHELAFKRLRDAVNRHTDWYASGYNDGFPALWEKETGKTDSDTKNGKPRHGVVMTQAYSPFVASSYEMSKSDGFAQPGATVTQGADGRKHWMFVFKVHKDNWYTTQSLQNNVPVDFDRHWLDETGFGTVGLADAERAWDRLGTALEGELDSILYLHNLDTTGAPVSNDKLE